MNRGAILDRLFRRLYGSPLIQNNHRGELVEEIVAAALEPNWRLCAGDWASHDLEQITSRLRIQVKQSAARQTWHTSVSKQSPARFSIATKSGRYEGSDFISEPGRNAEIYIFAWHEHVHDSADQADPAQWQFFVIAEKDLPAQSSIGLIWLKSNSHPANFDGLLYTVDLLAAKIAPG